MSDCDRFEPTLEAYVAGERDEGTLGPLLNHCRACESCRSVLSLHRDLVALAAQSPEPVPGDFDRMQERVLHEIARTRPHGRRWHLDHGWRIAASLAAALLLFAAGFATGRGPGEGASPSGRSTAIDRVVREIAAGAAAQHLATELDPPRLTFSNVAYRPMGDGRIALDFDVTTHVQFVEPLSSDLVREILAHSLMNPSSIGTRLRAISLAANVRESRITDALIFAVRHDENLAVRLEALKILGDRLHEPRVEAALLETLRSDEAVQMRLTALERLAEHRIDPQYLRDTIERGATRPGNEALRVHLASYERL